MLLQCEHHIELGRCISESQQLVLDRRGVRVCRDVLSGAAIVTASSLARCSRLSFLVLSGLAQLRGDIDEVISSGRTIDYASRLFLTTGDPIYSNRSNVLLDIVEDTVGRHDFLLTPDGLERAAAFPKIRDARVRRKVVELVRALLEAERRVRDGNVLLPVLLPALLGLGRFGS